MSKFEQKIHGAFQIVIARKLRACFCAVVALVFSVVSPVAVSADYTVNTTASPSALTGLWGNQSESGWGATLTQQYDVIFVAMYTYDGAGNPVWYVASNCAVSGAGCQGDLYKVTGGSMPTVTWNGNNKVVTAVGTITLVFTDNDTGTMNYTINGAPGSKAITRQVWRTAAPSAANYAGTWVANYGGYSITATVTQAGNSLSFLLSSPILAPGQVFSGEINGNIVNTTKNDYSGSAAATVTLLSSTSISATITSCSSTTGYQCVIPIGAPIAFTKQ